MATVGSIITNQGKIVILNRAYKASPDYLAPSQFKVGITSNAPNVGDTDLDNPIPISNGTVLEDGSRTLTGKIGGDNSTNNTTTFKQGAGTNDATGQNLIADATDTSGTKFWYRGSVARVPDLAKEVACWLYIDSTKVWDTLKTSGSAVEFRIGSGTGSDYYFWQFRNQNMRIGWNWMRSGTQINQLRMAGSVSGTADSFSISMATNNASDAYSSGSVVFDLLRQWETSDTLANFISGSYPSVDETALTVEMRGQLATTQANGFDIDSFGDFNQDSSRKMLGEDVFTAESKSDTDRFTFVIQDRLN